MDKEDVVHRYNGISLSHKRNNIWSLVEMWMDLEYLLYRVKYSEREKQMSSINTGMWTLDKMVQMNLLAGQE